MSKFWWQEPEGEDLANAVTDTVNKMISDHSYRYNLNMDMLRMYTGRDYEALDRYDPSNRGTMPFGEDYRMRLNVIGSCVDTLVSRIGKSRPRPMYLTKRGDYNLRQRALRLTDLMEGVFHNAKVYEHMTRVFQDSLIFDIGALKIGRHGSEIWVERVFPSELYWDLNAAMFDRPPALHQVKQIPMESLIQMYPEKAEEIEYYAVHSEEYKSAQGADADMIQVVESWHLPSIEDADDGLHCMTMDGLQLDAESWDYDRFPFVFLKWGDAGVGFAGVSLAEQLKNIQFEINKLALRIQQAMHLLSVPWIFVQAGSRVVDTALRNQVGSIVNYVGNPPTSYTPTAMHPEVYAHLDRLYQLAYQQSGLSEMSATGRKPAGLESGAALRTFHDIESERFMHQGQKYEQAFMEVAEWCMDLGQEIVQEFGKWPVKGIKDNALFKLDFKDLNMAEEDFTLQPYPVSLLPSTPAGRLSAVTELINTGVITDPAHIVRLLEFPDMEALTGLYRTFERDMEWRISEIVEFGRYHQPEPVMNLKFASERMAQAFLEGQQDGLETEKLNLMNDFIADCQALLAGEQQTPEGAAPAGEAPAGPPEDMMAALTGAAEPAPGPEGPPMGIPAGVPPVPAEPEPLPA